MPTLTGGPIPCPFLTQHAVTSEKITHCKNCNSIVHLLDRLSVILAIMVENDYRSYSGFNDELVWAATWLYRATNNVTYLNDAEAKFTQFGMASQYPGTFDWDDKRPGIFVSIFPIV